MKARRTAFVALGLALLSLAGLSGRALAQDDGARAYFLAPNTTHVLTAYGLFLRGNQSADPATYLRGAKLDVNLGLLQYTHPITIGGNAGGLFAILPFGEVKGRIAFGNMTANGRSSGIGDVQVGGVLGIVGTPSLSPQEYAAYKPGFSLGMLAKVVLPTGEYTSEKIINLGANRFAFKVGLPITYYLGESMVDPSLTTFEILPAATVFTANHDPFGANRVEQAPLYTVEGHITRNLNRTIWISADALYTLGGETRTDGVSDANKVRTFALGATLGATLGSNLTLKATYGQRVLGNQDDVEGKLFRLSLSGIF